MNPRDPLIDFVAAVSGDGYLKVEESLGDGYVRLRVSEAERRQAKHDIRSCEDIIVELLRNARDAHASRIFVATVRDAANRFMTVLDDGTGIPSTLQEAVFEPRVTSKLETMVMDRWGVHGRGMALFSIKTNATVARIAASAPHKGTALTVVVDTTVLTERADQSTWPTVEQGDDSLFHVVRGPHNIVRRLIEFGVEHPAVELYYGTPTEILATLYELGRHALDAAELMFCDDLERLPLWQRPAAAADALDLTQIAESIGLPVSERTAHRILADELAPLEPLLDQVLGVEEPEPKPAPDIYRDRRSLRIDHADLASFRCELSKVFNSLGERYYVTLKGEPKISVNHDAITVRFLINKDD